MQNGREEVPVYGEESDLDLIGVKIWINAKSKMQNTNCKMKGFACELAMSWPIDC